MAAPAAAVSAAMGAGGGGRAAVTSRTQLRRQQRQGYVAVLRAKLVQEAGRVLAAQAWLEGQSEVMKRLRMAAPVVEAGLVGQVASPCERRRRNAALHCFSADAGWIAGATAAQLNRLQRGGVLVVLPEDGPGPVVWAVRNNLFHLQLFHFHKFIQKHNFTF